MGLTRDNCTPVSNTEYKTVPLRSWAPTPGSQVPVPAFNVKEPAVKWVNWARFNPFLSTSSPF